MKTIEGRLWGIGYAHHYRETSPRDGQEYDHRRNGSAHVFARTADEALALFREAYPDPKTYVVHNLVDNGGDGSVIFSD